MNAHEHRPPELEGELAPSLDDPRVVEALERYLTAVEAGERPNRQAFLARHADIAEALAACLDGMEALHGAAASPRDTPPVPRFSLSQEKEEADGPAGLSAEVQPEAPLGDFRIVREIGRGGMGIVYEAVQMSLGRRVALKVLPFAAALDARQLQRFKTEAQAAAHLHHTNIVPVYAVGCERGVHFYAMQLIEGLNLAVLIEDLRRCLAPGGGDAARPRPGAESTGPYPGLRIADCGLRIGRGDDSPVLESAIRNPQSAICKETRPALRVQLSTQRSEQVAEFFRTVARLTAQAAEALDHAHGVGVVHRDVKPANLLVDERGNLWITDFGLARLHDDAGLTQSGDLLGTLRYMSPEQAGGPRLLIDHRTDVYSLGATLYELLTLRPIFDGADRQTLLHQIMHEEPRPPRTIDRSIPPELETIVLKAVAKLPAERYATARDLAQDLHRFLRHEPILARRPTLVQRARKWLRRHPSVVVAAVVLLGMLTAGSLVAALLIQNEKEKTRQAYERERQRAEEAEQRFQLARQSVDEMIQLAEQELAGKPHLERLRKRLLETALVYYQEFIEQRRDDPGAQADLAATQARVRRILADLALLQGAGQYYLLGDSDVLDDLRPPDEQRAQIGELSRKLGGQWMGAFHNFHRLTAEEWERRLVELARASDAAVTAVLTPGQMRRLKQIALQTKGTAAFRDPDIVAALKLTADQKASIRAIEVEAFFAKPEKPPRPGEPRKAHDPAKAQKAAVERIQQTVLTEEQRKRWRELTGEPFKGPLGFFRPRPPGGPPGPPGPFGPPR